MGKRPGFASWRQGAGLVRTSDTRPRRFRIGGQDGRGREAGSEVSSCPGVLIVRAWIERDGWCNPAAPDLRAEPSNRKELAVDRAAKQEAIAELKGVFSTSEVVVVAHYSGLTVSQMQTLRKQMSQAGGKVKVAKNRLAKIALEGTDAASIAPLMKGPTVIAYSGDPVAAPKVAVDFAKTNEKFVILGGSMGKTSLDLDGVKALASLPSLDELRGKLVGLIMAPATKIAQLANAPAAKVARVVSAYASKAPAA